MSAINRRDVMRALPAILTVATHPAHSQSPTEPLLSTPRVFPHEALAVKKNANGSETRGILHGTLVTGESVEIHETTLAVGGVPNPPHRHRQSDIILIREGTVAFEHDGKSEQVAAGGVFFVASDTMHTLRNAGDIPARYFVVIIGRDQPTPAT